MLPSPDPEKEALRAKLKADIKAFLKSGGKIQHIPPGVCVLKDRPDTSEVLDAARKKGADNSKKLRSGSLRNDQNS